MQQLHKASRESTSKVRTGCATCKARRVKCDEGKPTCRRCTAGGRHCEYQSPQVSGSSTNINKFTVYLPSVQAQPVLVAGDRSRTYFQYTLAEALDGGHFESEFWSKLVLQLSHSESAVRHAVAAASILYEDVEESMRHPNGFVKANPRAHLEWTAAVKSLTARIDAHPDSMLVPLVCCLLFICIEFFKGKNQDALLHAQNGLRIMAAFKGNTARGGVDVMADELAPVFDRLNLLCLLTAGADTPANLGSPHELAFRPVQTFSQSREQLVQLCAACLRFIQTTTPKASCAQVGMEDFAEQARLLSRLQQWRTQLTALVEKLQISGIMRPAALHILLVHYKTMYIWTTTCISPSEMATDAYVSDFEEIIMSASQILKTSSTTSPLALSFDVHLVGSVYFTALKCRHPRLRRRALELLRYTPRREGFWNAHYAYMTAQRIIDLEEREVDARGWPQERSRLYGLVLPDDESRVSATEDTSAAAMSPTDDGLVRSPAYPATLETVFHTKPWGLMGESQMITEYIEQR